MLFYLMVVPDPVSVMAVAVIVAHADFVGVVGHGGNPNAVGAERLNVVKFFREALEITAPESGRVAAIDLVVVAGVAVVETIGEREIDDLVVVPGGAFVRRGCLAGLRGGQDGRVDLCSRGDGRGIGANRHRSDSASLDW